MFGRNNCAGGECYFTSAACCKANERYEQSIKESDRDNKIVGLELAVAEPEKTVDKRMIDNANDY